MKLALGLGASLGPRRATLERTLARLDARPDVAVLRVSRWYRSAPMSGGTARGLFLNGVALLDLKMTPRAFLDLCRGLEHDAGRRRARYWSDRPLDLDLLVADGLRSDDPDLTLPHPGVLSRAFVYWPLLEVWPEALDQFPVPRPPPPPRHGIVAVGAFARRPGRL
jgi:2-amino-4-hydroxy-6-hydroxymethyldihydropteridine diphosphokinase